jgi:hypothetical protein
MNHTLPHGYKGGVFPLAEALRWPNVSAWVGVLKCWGRVITTIVREHLDLVS